MPLQNELSGADIQKKLEGYKLVKPGDLKKIQPGDRIRYMLNNEFRGGGAVKINRWPSYIVLINVMNKATWCMQLKEPTLKVWMKSMGEVQKEREQKEKIFQLYKEGKLIKKK